MIRTSEAVVGRVRRPSWRDPRLLVGLVLIAVAVASVVGIVRRADTTQPFYAAARDLAPGTVLSDGDLVVVHVRVSAREYVPQSDAVTGRVVDRTIGEGELIPASALVSTDAYASRSIAITTSMPLAEGVGVGSLVDVWVTRSDDAGPHSERVGDGLAITDVVRASTSLGSARDQTVYVAVPLADVGAMLEAVASGGEIAIVATGA